MENLKFLTRTNVKDGDKVLYFYYNLPDTSNFSNFHEQAYPLIEELKDAMPLIKNKTLEMNGKLAKITSDNTRKIKDLKQQLEKEKQETQKKVDKLKELNAKHKNLETEKQRIKNRVYTTNNNDNQSLIDDLTNKADELAKDYEQARDAEDKVRDQLKQQIDLIKNLEEAATQSANSINLLTSKIDELNLQLDESKKEAKPQTENAALKSLNEALQRALKATGKNSTKSTPHKLTDDQIVINDEDSSKRSNKIKLKINTCLQTFSGLPHQNVNEYLHSADRVFDFGQYTDNEKVNVASSYLKGIAFSDWLLHEQENGKQTWKQFTDYMKKKYIPANHSQVIRARIKNLKKMTSVKDYYVEFRSLSIQAPEMNTDEKLDHFINNLKPELSKQVHLKECKTIEAAYDAAVLFETFGQPTNNTKYSFMATHQNNTSNINTNYNTNNNLKFYQQPSNQNNFADLNDYSNQNSYNHNYQYHNYNLGDDENQYQIDENDYNYEETEDYNDQNNDDNSYNSCYNEKQDQIDENYEDYEEYYNNVYY
jgi:hypothetical protein